MNLADLNKISIKDLKEIDWGQVKDSLLSQPTFVVNTILITATIVTAAFAYTTYSDTTKSQNKEIVVLKKKVEAVANLTKTQNDYQDFLKNMPEPISENRLTEILSEIAFDRKIQIISFSPVNTKDNDYVQISNIKIKIKSDNYANIIRFMRDIEKSHHSIRTKSLSGNASRADSHLRNIRNSQLSEDTPKKEFSEATVEIEIVEFKDV